MPSTKPILSCGRVAASFNRLRALGCPPPARAGFGGTEDSACLGARQAPPLALLVLPIAPAAARAVAKVAPPSRAPVDVLSTGLLIVIVLVALVRTLVRRARVRRELQAPAELLRVPVSEMAMFDGLREKGDQQKLEEAWRDLVARKRAEREKRIAATLAQQSAPLSLRDLDPTAGNGRRLASAAEDARSWTAVKAAAAQINGQRSYLSPAAEPAPFGADSITAYPARDAAGGWAAPQPPTAPPAAPPDDGWWYGEARVGAVAQAEPADRRFPPPRSFYKRPPSPPEPLPPDTPLPASDDNGAAAADARAADAQPARFAPGALAQRFAASRAGSASQTTSASDRPAAYAASPRAAGGAGVAGRGPLAAELRAASWRAAERAAEAREPARAPSLPQVVQLPTRSQLAAPSPLSPVYPYLSAAAGGAIGRTDAERSSESGARTIAAAAGRAAGAVLKLPVVAIVAFVKALVEPLPPVVPSPDEPWARDWSARGAAAASAQAKGSVVAAAAAAAVAAPQPVQSAPPVPRYLPPPTQPRAQPAAQLSPPAPAPTQAAGAPVAKPSAAWDILAAKHAQIDQMIERGGGAAPPRA
ncbi:hypothetical protein KFE25_013254 [Diacronema lutheri]|uniref:Uncharacterized protein n=2 Tax=Diacronema lutheri TaxID=2081491 RepID=A0A8J6CEJ2_DIALT|nr:hypothetical protein KFE25_013254 [Diacronema lutheri]